MKNDLDQRIGETLKQLRKKKRMTMRQVATDLQINFSYIGKIEKGRIPSLKLLNELATYYGSSTITLLGESQSSLGDEWSVFSSEMKNRGITPDDLRRMVDAAEKLILRSIQEE